MNIYLPEGAREEPTKFDASNVMQLSYTRNDIKLTIVVAETFAVFGAKPVIGVRNDAIVRAGARRLTVEPIAMQEGLTGFVATPDMRDAQAVLSTAFKIVYVGTPNNTVKAISFYLSPRDDKSYGWNELVLEIARHIQDGKHPRKTGGERSFCPITDCAMSIKLKDRWILDYRPDLVPDSYIVTSIVDLGSKAPVCEMSFRGQPPADASSYSVSTTTVLDGSPWMVSKGKDVWRAFAQPSRSPRRQLLIKCEAASNADLMTSINVLSTLRAIPY